MNLKAIGRRIKAAREQKGLTQEALAELVDLSPMHISVIERGFKPTKLDTFCNIANVLDVSADTLLQDVINRSADSVPSDLNRSERFLHNADLGCFHSLLWGIISIIRTAIFNYTWKRS